MHGRVGDRGVDLKRKKVSAAPTRLVAEEESSHELSAFWSPAHRATGTARRKRHAERRDR